MHVKDKDRDQEVPRELHDWVRSGQKAYRVR